jgi:hypothetical protein
MKSTTPRIFFIFACFLALLGVNASAQTVNPKTDIRWPASCTGTAIYYNIVTGLCPIPPSGITQITGPVTAGPGSGSVASTIAGTGVTPGTYNSGTLALVINAAGQITSAGSPFSANFTCASCGSIETGLTTNPSNFTISYANPTLPTSASISDGTHSVTLTTPFTTGSLAFNYCTPAQGIVNFTFTLTAVGSAQTVTPSRTINCLPRSFGGTGTGASATGATASGSTAILVGAAGNLVSGGLAASSVGQVYNVTTSGTQYVYLLLATNVSNPGSGSFTTPGPTVFAMNAPTVVSFTNQYGTVITMYLYRSVNSFFSGSNFIITVNP